MKKLIIAAISASALAAAVPAMAQTYLGDRASQADQRIDDGVRDGSLTAGEASTLRSRLNDIERTQDDYRADGMAGWQRRALERRYDELSNDIYSMRHNVQYRYHRSYYDNDDIW